MERREVKGVYVAFVNILSLLTYNKICRQVQSRKEKKTETARNPVYCAYNSMQRLMKNKNKNKGS